MALGATPRNVAQLIMMQTTKPVAFGLVAGAGLAVALATFLLSTRVGAMIAEIVRLTDPFAQAAVVDVIDRTIVPELRATAGRLRALNNVAPEHQRIIEAAEQFLILRDESWQQRAAALHNSDMLGLRNADTKEQASHEAFNQLKMPLPPKT